VGDQQTTSLTSWLILFILAFTWGSSFILMKYILFTADGEPLFSATQVACIRLSLAGLVLLPIALRNLKVLRKNFWPLLIVGLFGNGFPAFFFPLAQQHLDSSFVGMLNSLVPFFTLMIAIFVFKTKVQSLQIFGVVIGLLGAISLISLGGGGGEFNIGYSMFVVGATISYGISVNTIKNVLNHVNSVVIAALALGLMGIPAGIYLLTTDFVPIVTETEGGLRGLGFGAILAIVGTAGALIIFNKLVKDTSAVFASSVTYVIPIFAVLWGVFDDEKFTFLHAISGAVVLLGVYLVNLGGRRMRRKERLKS
jgi:drug/metabolite transporter (DMT)-like permease